MPQQQKVGRPNDRKDDEFQRDLNPNPMAGQNSGMRGTHSEHDNLNAFDLKELHEQLPDFTSDELKQIIVLPPGSRLEQGAKYIDLMDPQRQEFTAMGNMEAGSDKRYVPKTEIDYQLWNRLTDVQ